MVGRRRIPAKSGMKKGGFFPRRKIDAKKTAPPPPPEWLPPDWKMEVRTRQGGTRVDKYYTSPVDGCILRSKNEVLRYLETMNPEEGGIFDRGKMTAKPLEWLPLGWKVEVRTRQSGSTAGMQDKYYIDPSTGYKFNSLAKVWDYLKNGQQHGRRCSSKHLLKKPASAARRHVLNHSTARQSLFGRQKSGRESAEPSSSVCQNVDHSKGKASNKQPAASRDKLLGNRNIISNDGLNAGKTGSNPIKLLESHLVHDPYTNQSSDPNLSTLTDNNLNENRNPHRDEIEDLTSARFEVKGNKNKHVAIAEDQKRKRDGSSSKGKTSKPIMSPCRRSKRLAGLKAELDPSFDNIVEKAPNQPKSAAAAASSPGAQNHEKTPEGVGTEMLTTNIMPQASELAKDGPDCLLHPSLSGIWQDPCLEFAFKTLTDSIPLDCMLPLPNGLLLQSESLVKSPVTVRTRKMKEGPSIVK